MSNTNNDQTNLEKLQIWTDDWQEYDPSFDHFGCLYSQDDIKKAVDIDHDNYYLTGITNITHDYLAEDLEELTEKYAEFKARKESSDDDFYDEYNTIENLEEFFAELEIDVDIASCTDEEPSRYEIAFNWNDSSFEELADFDEIEYVSYLDGQTNWQRHSAHSVNVTELTIDKESFTSMDKWNGHNWQTGGTGLHQCFYEVVEIDGEKVNNMCLVVCTSQWQGERDSAKIMDKNELMEYLQEISRDPEEYNLA